jgi:hypothetical protein
MEDSLLPYREWTEQAMREVMVRALAHVAAEGLPGEHHFYLTFRTDHPGTIIPPRLKAQYPHEITIVLQHQFWGLAVDPAAGVISVGLSFGGVPATLRIPVVAVTAFADPHARFGARFADPASPAAAVPPPGPPQALAPPAAAPVADNTSDAAATGADPVPQVVSLDAFRRRPPRE